METDEINKNLDVILSILKLRVKNAGGIQSYLKDAYQIDLSSQDVQMLLKQLEGDKFITIDNGNAGRCYITTPGRLFAGYVATYLKTQSELNDASDLKSLDRPKMIHEMEVDKAIVHNGVRLNQLTLWLVLVTAVLALIALGALYVAYLAYEKKA